ncbi:hypothetical protein WNY59_02290 [Ahrensia kielensis]|uniref:Uncharacterized protein n=1 Tax=Ahrensia kielensis TaxID=76980 RepID=A0ABU9T2Q7_9HYPH
MDRQNLETALLKAHSDEDYPTLITLYTKAAEGANDKDAEFFYLTHAFVFALEHGAPEAKPLNKRLADQGRAQLLEF